MAIRKGTAIDSSAGPDPDPGTAHSSPPKFNIDNPLRGRELQSAVKRFVVATKLEDLTDVILRGAYLAEDLDNFNNVEGLTDVDFEALRREQNELNPFKILSHLTNQLWTIIITCSLAAVCQGWDQAAMGGANQYWPLELGLDLTRNRDVWLFGLINASSFLFAAIFGSWLSDPINTHFMGRRSAIFISAVLSFIPVVGAGVCQDWVQLLVCRILLGIGIGIKAAVVPIYASETAPTAIRGGVVMNWQFCIGVGFILGNSMNLALLNLTHFNWRLQIIASALPAIPLLFIVYTCSESPRFLIKTGKWRAAYNSLKSINEVEVQAAREIFLIHIQNELTKIQWYSDGDPQTAIKRLFPSEDDKEEEREENIPIALKSGQNDRVDSYFKRLVNLFTVPRIRRATVAASVVMISQQLCGVNVISFYSGVLLPPANPDDPASVKSTNYNALWLGWGVSILSQIADFLVFLTIDRWGRRTLCLFATPILGICLFAAGLCYLLPPGSSEFIGSLFFFIFTFSFFYEALGAVPFAYSAEVFPNINREAGMTLAIFINFFGAGCVGLFVPFIQSSLGGIGLFELFAGLNVIAFILMYIFVYETKQESLERLDRIFEIRTATHLKYQLTEVLPWCLRNMFRSARDREILDSLVLWKRKRDDANANGMTGSGV